MRFIWLTAKKDQPNRQHK